MDIDELMAERDGLTLTHIAKLYAVDFERDLIERATIPKQIWNDAKGMIGETATLDSLREYINKRLIEEKKELASPASSSGKKGKGLSRILTKATAKANPRAKSRATEKDTVYVSNR